MKSIKNKKIRNWQVRKLNKHSNWIIEIKPKLRTSAGKNTSNYPTFEFTPFITLHISI